MNGLNDLNLTPNDTHTGTAIMSVKSSTGNVTCHCDTEAGSAFVEKYLHPPRPTRSEYAGIPDKNTTPSAFAEYKMIQQIQTYKVATPDTIYYPNVLFIYTSSAIAPIITIPFKLLSDGTFSADEFTASVNPNINVQDMIRQNASGRLEYKSTTISLNATAFNNQGVVTTSQFRPNISIYRAGDLIENHYHEMHDAEKMIETLYKFYNIKYVPPTKIDPQTHHLQHLGVAVDNYIQILSPGTLPSVSTPIAMMSPNSTSVLATEGSFVVQKFDIDSIPYKSFANSKDAGSAPGTYAGMPCYIRFQNPSVETFALYPIRVVGQPGNATEILTDLPWFDFNWGYSLYEGMSIGFQNGSTPPYLTVKAITGFAFQPLPNSALSPFIRESAMYDQEAIRFISMTNHAMPDSLPAKMNFWGSLGKILLSSAPQIIETISNIFGKKRTNDERKTTKSTVDALTAKISQLQSRLSAPMPRQSNANAPNRRMYTNRRTTRPTNQLAIEYPNTPRTQTKNAKRNPKRRTRR